MPERIQRKRSRGWTMPRGAVYVGRPTKWGSPFKVGEYYMRGDVRGVEGKFGFIYTHAITAADADSRFTKIETTAEAVEWFRWYVRTVQKDCSELRGKDLTCWCPLDQPCHADVLLEVANA